MRNIAIYCLAFIIIYLLVRDCVTTPFPNGYEWTESLINYEGGFLRRGLLGQFLYFCAGTLNVQILGLAAHASAWLLLFRLAATRIVACLDRISATILLLWPVYFLFFIRTPPAFLRKDQFVNLLSFLAVIALVRASKAGARCLAQPTAIFISCFCAAFLIHEESIFYFTLPAWLLGLLWAQRQKTGLWLALMAFLFLSAAVCAIFWQGTPDHARLIEASWRAYYPDFGGGLALDYLGKPLAVNLADEAAWRSDWPIALSAMLALWIALVPVVWVCAVYRVFQGIRFAIPRFFRLLLPLAALCPWLMPLIAIDFGRHIAMASLQYIFWLWAMISIFQLEPCGWLKAANAYLAANRALAAFLFLALLLFSLSLVLLHWTVPGQSLIMLEFPGMV